MHAEEHVHQGSLTCGDIVAVVREAFDYECVTRFKSKIVTLETERRIKRGGEEKRDVRRGSIKRHVKKN